MELKNLITQNPGWLQHSENDSVILSAEVAFQRNLDPYPFPQKASLFQKSEIFSDVVSAVVSKKIFGEDPFIINLNDVSDIAKTVLFERDYIPIQMVNGGTGDRGVILNDSRVTIQINGANHIRIFAHGTSAEVTNMYEQVDIIDTILGEQLTYAFDPSHGFLLNRPDACGCGLELVYTMQLSGLVHTQTLEQVLSGAAQLGVLGAGKFRQGADSWGGLFTLTGGHYLGNSETEILTKCESAIKEIADREREAREQLFKEAPLEMEDKIWRSLGVLKYARMLSVPQLLNLTSTLKLGIEQGIDVEGLKIETVNSIISDALQGNIALIMDELPTESSDLDVQRAEVVRSILSNIDNEQ